MKTANNRATEIAVEKVGARTYLQATGDGEGGGGGGSLKSKFSLCDPQMKIDCYPRNISYTFFE